MKLLDCVQNPLSQSTEDIISPQTSELVNILILSF